MIKINVNPDLIKISGHANFSEYGSDIVCAATSSIVTTTINGILRLEPSSIEYEDSEGLVIINILKHTLVVDSLIDNMISLLKDLASKYEKNIKFDK